MRVFYVNVYDLFELTDNLYIETRNRALKKILLAIIFMLTFSAVSYATDLSSWAKDEYITLSNYGILEKDIVKMNLNENITRQEFCTLIVNVYEGVKSIKLEEKDTDIFLDTANESVIKAYKAGIVNGKGEGRFCPDDFITRQEMAVMISRALNKISPDYIIYTNQIKEFKMNFSDYDQTAQWAIADMAAVCKHEIITGTQDGNVEPLNFATREQAICMMSRICSVNTYNKRNYNIPVITQIERSKSERNVIGIKWTKIANVSGYGVIIKCDGEETVVIDVPKSKNSLDNYNLPYGEEKEYSIVVSADYANGKEVFSEYAQINKDTQFGEAVEEAVFEENQEDEVENDSLKESIDEEIKDETIENVTDNNVWELKDLSLEEKELRVFPEGVYFENAEEAELYMVEVEVPVWRLTEDGEKVESNKYIIINSALAEDVVNIFTEIFNDPSQFPIKNVGGYYWRNTASGRLSQHSYGTCIDINYNENYYVEPDGTPIVGSHWLPGEDPYSIAEDSIVVKTFAKYGWLWGGNCWGDKYARDYMHFTYLGK